MIEQESIENLKNRLDIVDVISSYMELRKSGANFKANCPFHGENTPSFTVSPAKQIYHCFGCGVGGDAIKFVMEYEKLNYPEAIEKLASQYNVDLRYSDKKKDSFDKEKKIIENLNLFFRKNLDHKKDAVDYLLDRGMYESSIEKFEIGFASESSKTLDYMREHLVSYNDSKDLGLVAVGEDGRPYARFSNRITFPIFSPSGNIVGFGGRTITNHPAKYINSPQSKIFDKSKLLYGYHKAKTSIFQKGEVIVTEGYLDVIMLHQAGFTNSVATLGTALTSYHVPIISRGNPRVILAYDGDKAGREAAFKAASMLGAKSTDGGVVIFGSGLDPADMVKDHQLEELNNLFRSPKPLVEYALEYIVSKFDIKNPIQKEEALKESSIFLQTLSSVLRDEYKVFLSAILGVNERLVRVKQTDTVFSQVNQNKKEDIPELNIIKTLLSKPNLIDMIGKTLFRTHAREYELLLEKSYDNPLILGIKIRDDLKELSEEDFKVQICLFLIKYNEDGVIKIKRNSKLSLAKKSFYFRKINENLKRLKKGMLVAYEDFGEVT